MLDDVNFGHSLLTSSSRNMILEVLVAVVNSLHSAPLPGVPPGHGYWDWRRYGVAKHWVVDHSALQFFSGKLRFYLVVPVPGGVFLHVDQVSLSTAKTRLRCKQSALSPELSLHDRPGKPRDGRTSWGLP